MALEKLTIYASTSDPGRNGRVGSPLKVAINPEKLVHKREIKYNSDGRSNTSNDPLQFKGYANDEVSFDAFFDNTSITPGGLVASDIRALIDHVYTYDGSIHKPKFLVLAWGADFTFVCHLKTMSIDYTLFASDGAPMRAKVSMVFVGHVDPSVGARLGNRSSPDMTHIKIIRMGDSITQMCKDVYENPEYYTIVAGINQLTNFRKLNVGGAILIPPIEK
ncbi:MAG: hypothetical protein RLZZ292_1030 [Bacteroidota bacterium]|jgi:hypothetical protein